LLSQTTPPGSDCQNHQRIVAPTLHQPWPNTANGYFSRRLIGGHLGTIGLAGTKGLLSTFTANPQSALQGGSWYVLLVSLSPSQSLEVDLIEPEFEKYREQAMMEHAILEQQRRAYEKLNSQHKKKS
jgi:hypothetical protein